MISFDQFVVVARAFVHQAPNLNACELKIEFRKVTWAHFELTHALTLSEYRLVDKYFECAQDAYGRRDLVLFNQMMEK